MDLRVNGQLKGTDKSKEIGLRRRRRTRRNDLRKFISRVGVCVVPRWKDWQTVRGMTEKERADVYDCEFRRDNRKRRQTKT